MSKREAAEFLDDGLPPFINLADELKNLPQLAPCLIDGILRQGHKMLVAGPSKAGKSFALIELCIAIAEGRRWLQWQCTRCKVLYVNLELDRASCIHRFDEVYETLKWEFKYGNNIYIWNLRGKLLNMEQLAEKLIYKTKNKNITTVILDPIYKVNSHSENSAYGISQLCNLFDRICSELHVSFIYCHHHSKGDQSWKRPLDRASGSGVFARDVDALLDFTELELPPEMRSDERSAWRVSCITREFPPHDPIDVWFKYPVHYTAEFDGEMLIMPHHELPAWKRAMNGRSTKEEKLEKRKKRLECAIASCSQRGPVTVATLAEEMSISKDSVRRSIDEHPNYYRIDGRVERSSE